MSKGNYDKLNADYGEILAGLEQLRDRLDAVRYPGQAWRRPGRRRLLLVVGSAGVAAVAACVLLAVCLHGPAETTAPTEPAQASSVASASPAEHSPMLGFDTSLDLAAIGTVSVDTTAVSLPPAGSIAPLSSLDWSVPSFSIPSMR